MRKLAWFGCALVLCTSLVSAQCAVVTHFGTTNGQKGAMFDIENISAAPVTVIGLDQTFLLNTISPCFVEVYTHAGSFIGTQNDPVAWGAPLGTNPSLTLTATGVNTAVPLGIPMAVTIAPGATQAFWVTCTAATASNVLYTSGPAGGLCGIMATDGVLNIRRGVGKTYPLPGTTFGMTTGQLCGANSGRGWNGRVYYQSGPTVSWQTNSANSTLNVNGVNGGPCAKATSTLCAGSATTVNMQSALAGMPSELAFNLSPTVGAGAGALITPAGQLVNLDFLGGLFFLYGGVAPAFLPHPGSAALSFGMAPITIAAQQIVVDPTNADGFTLSQASEVTGVAGTGTMAGPVGDDATVTVIAGAAPLCMPPLLMYGTVHSTMHVSTNGWVNFTAVNNGFTPTTATFNLQRCVGLWADMNTATVAGGTITINNVGSTVSVNYSGVGYYGTTIPNTYSINTDAATGVWSLSGLSGVSAHTANQIVGISPGGATNLVSTVYSPAASTGTVLAATDSIFNFGVAGSAVAGLNDITFSPDGLGNYAWLSQ